MHTSVSLSNCSNETGADPSSYLDGNWPNALWAPTTGASGEVIPPNSGACYRGTGRDCFLALPAAAAFFFGPLGFFRVASTFLGFATGAGAEKGMA